MRDCFILGPLTIHIVTRRPNPQGLNPQRHLFWFFWCCWCAVQLPLPIPRVLSELPRACKGSQCPCTWGALSAVSSTWGWKQCGHRLTSAEHESQPWGTTQGPQRIEFLQVGTAILCMAEHPGAGGRQLAWPHPRGQLHFIPEHICFYLSFREHLQFGEEITAFHALRQGWRGCSKVRTTLAWDLLLSRSSTGKPQTTPTKDRVCCTRQQQQHTSCLPFFHIQWIW